VLITVDQDFGHLIFVEERSHRGLIRLPTCPAKERIAIIADLLARHFDALADRAIITVRGGRVRISRPLTP
jgi:predicted nuclease of predicted toxin-antitoxin system